MKPAVFLDRDGVLNRRKWRLVRHPDELVLIPGIAEAAYRLTHAGFTLVIATNQEFVGHGYIKREHHDAIMDTVVAELEREGGRIAAVHACLHSHGTDCDDRKPRPGMLLRAADALGLDLSRSYMVGDNTKDMLAGRGAGARTVLVDPRFRTWWQGARKHADHVAPDLQEAVDWMLQDSGLAPTAKRAARQQV